MEYSRIKGTNDIIPPESLLWKGVIAAIHEVFSSFGYSFEISPILEPFELFVRSIGEGTDIVNKEMFIFESKSGKKIALKPEETAVLMRSIIENNIVGDSFARKYYYITPIFRYERPQKGRYREFYQYGVEAVNTQSVMRDAEIIEAGRKIIDRFGIKNVSLEINSIGCRECRKPYRDELALYFRSNTEKLCDDCRRKSETNPMRILDCKNEGCIAVSSGAPVISDYLCSGCKKDFEDMQFLLKEKSIEFRINPRIVRGLDYYSKTVFEFVEQGGVLGSQSTLIGGGRYDYLAEEMGGRNMPSVGFAGGLERLLLSIPEDVRKQIIKKEGIDAVCVYFDRETLSFSERIAAELRKDGKKIEICYESDKIKKQMKYASSLGAAYAVICGGDELKRGVVTVKNLETQEQSEISSSASKILEAINRS